MRDITKVIEDFMGLETACLELATPMISKIDNMTLRVKDIYPDVGRGVSFTVHRSWQGNADTFRFSLPTDIVYDQMKRQIEEE